MDMLLRRRVKLRPKGRPAVTPPEPARLQSFAPLDPVLPPLCVRIPAAAKMLGIGRTKLYQLINGGEIETVKLDGAVLIPVRSLESFVARHSITRKRGE
ncbi:helix-turn-helix domain-containing protein [Sphingomonas sp. MMS12-HWE2-04]|uniref:helix-turn-helix domain-containing protein n=1 Tax=Sphingomonas sp. MMS12-HWE2-04 TaxID=3234199 RepID=UPI00384DA4B1